MSLPVQSLCIPPSSVNNTWIFLGGTTLPHSTLCVSMGLIPSSQLQGYSGDHDLLSCPLATVIDLEMGINIDWNRDEFGDISQVNKTNFWASVGKTCAREAFFPQIASCKGDELRPCLERHQHRRWRGRPSAVGYFPLAHRSLSCSLPAD